MKPRLSWLAVGAGAYLAFLAATFPAATAFRWFAPDDVGLVAPAGSIWSGRAGVVSVAGIAASDVRWNISPWQLLLGRLAGSIESRLGDGFASTAFALRAGGSARFEGGRLSTSIEALAGVLPVYDTRGQISATIESATIEDGWPVQIDGELRVGSLQVAPLIPDGTTAQILLGDFRAIVTSDDGGPIVARINDMDGPLELDGEISLNRDLSYLFSGRVRTRPDASAQLVQGINLMAGEPDSAGMRELTLSGSL